MCEMTMLVLMIDRSLLQSRCIVEPKAENVEKIFGGVMETPNYCLTLCHETTNFH